MGGGPRPRQSPRMCPSLLAGVVGDPFAHVLVGECCVKLKDYEIPQYGVDGGVDQEDLAQYSLKNFDLNAYQRTQQQPDPAPIPVLLDPPPSSSTGQSSNEENFSPAPNPVQTELNQPAMELFDVKFGAHFNLQTVSYNPLSPAQTWKMPRWVVTTVGLFFASAAVLAVALCVVLLRDPRTPPTGQLAPPTAPVATTSPAPAPTGSSSPMNAAPGDVARRASAPRQQATPNGYLADRAGVRHPGPAAAASSSVGHRIAVVSRHPTVVRRQTYRAQRTASKNESSSLAASETETASRPPQDALDKLLGESAL